VTRILFSSFVVCDLFPRSEGSREGSARHLLREKSAFFLTGEVTSCSAELGKKDFFFFWMTEHGPSFLGIEVDEKHLRVFFSTVAKFLRSFFFRPEWQEVTEEEGPFHQMV